METSFVSTERGAPQLGVSPATLRRICARFPGFAIRVGGQYRIPLQHVLRVRAGESPAAISAEVRANGPSRAA